MYRRVRTACDDVKDTPKKSKARGLDLFGWGRKSGDSADGADDAGEGTSPSKKHRPPRARRQRKFQRGNNAEYDWQGELERIYTSIKMPEKIPEIPTILKMFKGKEDEMLGSLLTKYKKLMSPDLYEYLDHLHATFENTDD